jgi:hypothetical protein
LPNDFLAYRIISQSFLLLLSLLADYVRDHLIAASIYSQMLCQLSYSRLAVEAVVSLEACTTDRSKKEREREGEAEIALQQRRSSGDAKRTFARFHKKFGSLGC